MASLKRRISEGVREKWIADTRTRMSGATGGGNFSGARDRKRGAFQGPDRVRGPTIRKPLRRAEKRVASVYYRLLSGHAMIAPFPKERWGWIDTDQCWWCNRGRQSRVHLFKECSTWA